MTASFVGATTNTPVGGGNSTDFFVPAGALAGDLLLAVFASELDSIVGHAPPAGWTTRGTIDGSGGGAGIGVYSKIATSTDHGTDYIFGFAFHGVNAVLAYRGVVAEPPDAGVTTGTGITAASLTPTTADDLDVAFFAGGSDATFGPPSGWNGRVGLADIFVGAGLLVIDRLDIASGSTGTVTAAGSAGSNPNHRNARGLWLTAIPYIQRNPAINHQNPGLV